VGQEADPAGDDVRGGGSAGGGGGPARRGDRLRAFGVALVVLLAFSWMRDLWDADEGRYAAVALEMRRSGDFTTPRENGMRFVDKPPLVYWGANAAYAVFGVSPFSARLPCIVAGAALAAAVFALGAAWTGRRAAGFASAAIAATSFAGFAFSRTVTMDMPLAASIAWACWFGWRGLTAPSVRQAAGLGVAVGAGLLAKGPLAAVVPGVVAISWGIVGAPWGRIVRVLLSPVAWGVALAIAAPWYALMESANPGYLRHFLVYEHFGRFGEKGTRDFAPVWLYAPVLLAGLFPWTHLLLGARLPRPAIETRRGPVSGTRLAWAWALGALVFYSFGRNRLYTYVLPAFAPLFVLAGTRLVERLEAGGRASDRLSGWAVAAGAIVLAAASVWVSGVVFERGWIRDARWAALGWPALFGSVPLLASRIAFGFLPAARHRAAWLVVAAAVSWWSIDLGAARCDDLRSARTLARTIDEHLGTGDRVVCLDCFPQGLRFHADLPFSVAFTRKDRQREIVEPYASLDGAGILLPPETFARLWSSPGRVLLVVRAEKAAPFAAAGARRLASGLAGYERSDLVLLENRPRGP
jgi:4-amino-4-deoxy-L-arabinose transferase-like glycosyltransferase